MTRKDLDDIIQRHLSHDIRNWVNGTDDSLVIDGPEKIICKRIGTRGFVIRYYNDGGLLHRTDGPAYIVSGESVVMMEWYREGFYHRDDGASILGIRNDTEFRYYNHNGVEIPTRDVDELLGGPYLDFTPDQTMLFMLTFQ